MQSQSKIDYLNELNPNIEIKSIRDNEFNKYGQVIESNRFKKIEEYLRENTEIPKEGNVYQANLEYFEGSDLKKEIENKYYGELPIEIGYCNGKNRSLNGLEYHNGSEINIAITDLILLLGEKKDIKEVGYDSKNIEAFYLQQGSVIELYGTSLHFAPCSVEKNGFKCGVILPAETNLPLESKDHDDPYLFAKNKWLLVHPEKKEMIKKGAKADLRGENIKLNI